MRFFILIILLFGGFLSAQNKTDSLLMLIKKQNQSVNQIQNLFNQQKLLNDSLLKIANKTQNNLAKLRKEQDSIRTAENQRLEKIIESFKTASKDTTETIETKQDTSPTQNLRKYFSGNKIFWTIILIGLGFLLVRILSHILKILAERSTKNRITFKGLIPILKIIIWLLVLFIIIVGVYHPPLETIIAVSASIAIAIGFAAQDILKNIFGGITILVDTPFKVGDKVEIGNYYGEVVEIGLVSTRIVTPDDSMINVPNGLILSSSLSNSNSGEPFCQVVAEIFLPPNMDTHKARQIAMEAAQTSRYVYLNKPIVVWFNNELKMNEPYIKMRLKAYVLDIRYEFDFKSDMTEIVLEEVYKNEKSEVRN